MDHFIPLAKTLLSLSLFQKSYYSDYMVLIIITFSSVKLHQTLCNPMDCSTPGFPVHNQLLELTQTHIYQVGYAIQPSHPLSSLSPPAFNLSQHQGLFQ